MRTIFRLFVSSTFNDFREERRVLQEEVFGEIEKYCASKNASFQPIDLRWGVSSEAQLDQQTLELCLNEVKLCKAKPYPNFLVMLGDRYGWIPLPFMIEKDEFEKMFLSLKNEKQKELLEFWYALDENQIPSSYRLRERKDLSKESLKDEFRQDFSKWEVWEETENSLREILQTLAKECLDKKCQEKYFTSATEAEIIEGVLPYKQITKHQEKLLNIATKEKDAQNIFAFYRSIEEDSKIDGMFVEHNPKLNTLKNELKSHLTNDNLLEVTTKQTQQDRLDTSYLEGFKQKTLDFLKQRVDAHIGSLRDEELNEDIQDQTYYKNLKLKNFLSTPELDETLKNINTYINDKNSTQTLVIQGKSGSGKSALMARAIENELKTEKPNSKLLYTFVGASSESTNIKEILNQIFKNFGVTLLRKQTDTNAFKSLSMQEKQESYEDFCYRVQDEFLKLSQKDEDIVIFIDALDQCNGDKDPLWLPSSLPKNVKVIISTLNDENYQEDSKVFKSLSHLNTIELKNFSRPKELLNLLLKQDSRRVSQKQEEYFLSCYENAQTPFYILLASQEMKKWKSYQEDYKLENTNKNITKEYILNLSELYHHDKLFIQKALCFILASRYGLSENEMLTLLNITIKYNLDESFSKSVASEQWHINSSKTLPLVHWSRFLTFLSPFLKKSSKDGEEIMSFFHREFLDALNVLYKDKMVKESENLLTAMSYKLKEVQHEEFDANRWGKLYGIVLCEYDVLFKNEDVCENRLREFCESVGELNNDEWNNKFLLYLLINGKHNDEHNYMYEAIGFNKSAYLTSKKFYKQNSNKWIESYMTSLNNLGLSYYKIDRSNEAIELIKQTLTISKELYKKNPKKWSNFYTTSLNNLATSYDKIGKTYEAIELYKEALGIRKDLYKQNPKIWVDVYVNSLSNIATLYSKMGRVYEAIEFQEKALEISKKLFKQNPQRWSENYTKFLTSLGFLYLKTDNIHEAIELQQKALEIIKWFYEQDAQRWAEFYASILNSFSHFYYKLDKIYEAIELQKQALEIRKKFYKQNPNKWAESYATSLNNLGLSYYKIDKINEAIELIKQALKISEEQYCQVPRMSAKYYAKSLNNLGEFYCGIGKIDKSIELINQALEVATKHLGADHSDTKQYMNNCMLLNVSQIVNVRDKKISEQANKITTFLVGKDYHSLDLLLYLSKGIAIDNDESYIDLDSFINALGYVDFKEYAEYVINNFLLEIFPIPIRLDMLPKYDCGDLALAIARDNPEKIKYEPQLNELIKKLREIFGDEPICRLRK